MKTKHILFPMLVLCLWGLVAGGAAIGAETADNHANTTSDVASLPLKAAPADCTLAWRFVDTPDGEVAPSGLSGVAAVAQDDVWLIGDALSNYITYPLIEHWDGKSLQIVSQLSYGGLAGVSVVQANDIWAVGFTNHHRTLTMHWNSSTWQVVPSPNANLDDGLYAVDAHDANDIWAVGYTVVATHEIGVEQTLIEHWDGSSWYIVPSANANNYAPNELYGVAAVAANDVWAVGYYQSYYSPSGVYTFIEHWNGFDWQIVDTPPLGNDDRLFGVVAIAADDVWAVGYYTGELVNYPLTLHWDGHTWKKVATPPIGVGTNGLRGVTALASNDVWAVGDYFPAGGGNNTLVEHWDGTSWQIVSSPSDGYHDILGSVGGVSPTDLWAVGSRYPGNPSTIAMHYSIPDGCLSPTPNPTTTAAPTNTATPTSIPTQTATPSATDTPPPTSTPLPLATATPCAASFSDVPTEYWAYGYIKYLACAHLTSGYPDGTYRPNTAISRAELSRIVALAYGVPLLTPAQPSFSDVPASYWAYAYIEGLHSAGVISGYPDGSFRPNASISRAEIVKLVVAASGTPQYTGAFTDYPDVPQSHWAYSYIKTASHQQWVGGYPDGHFGPNAAATRAELAKTVYLALVFPRGRR